MRSNQAHVRGRHQLSGPAARSVPARISVSYTAEACHSAGLAGGEAYNSANRAATSALPVAVARDSNVQTVRKLSGPVAQIGGFGIVVPVA
jgi:hypothetical protein